MPKCVMCDGTGQRHYTLSGRNADGSTSKQDRSYTCAWCEGKGEVSEMWAKFVELEQQRLDGAGIQKS